MIKKDQIDLMTYFKILENFLNILFYWQVLNLLKNNHFVSFFEIF